MYIVFPMVTVQYMRAIGESLFSLFYGFSYFFQYYNLSGNIEKSNFFRFQSEKTKPNDINNITTDKEMLCEVAETRFF